MIIYSEKLMAKGKNDNNNEGTHNFSARDAIETRLSVSKQVCIFRFIKFKEYMHQLNRMIKTNIHHMPPSRTRKSTSHGHV